MKYKKQIIVLLLIAYLGIGVVAIINDNSNPVVYGLIIGSVVCLILSLIYVTRAMNRELEEEKK